MKFYHGKEFDFTQGAMGSSCVVSPRGVKETDFHPTRLTLAAD